jgi:hypothetical protein
MFFYPFQQTKRGIRDYTLSIMEQRKKKDEYMRSDKGSPFVTTGTQFKELKYYVIDRNYRISAIVNPLRVKEPVRMLLSDGTTENYIPYASVDFILQMKPQHLILYKSEEDLNSKSLFLPFFDETSALTTYGGGRYLEPEYTGGKNLILDFNLAYNPYCAYVDGYSCPVPPAGNRINVEVIAGEKIYKNE